MSHLGYKISVLIPKQRAVFKTAGGSYVTGTVLLNIECKKSSYVQCSRKHWKCKYLYFVGLSQGLRRSVVGLAAILAPLWAGSTVDMPYVMFVVNIGLVSMSVVGQILCISSKQQQIGWGNYKPWPPPWYSGEWLYIQWDYTTNLWTHYLHELKFSTEFWEVSINHKNSLAFLQGTLTPLDTWSHAIRDLHLLYSMRPVLLHAITLLIKIYGKEKKKGFVLRIMADVVKQVPRNNPENHNIYTFLISIPYCKLHGSHNNCRKFHCMWLVLVTFKF